MKVYIEKYNSSWKKLFIKESYKIKQIFGNELHSIHHIGSTSIDYLSAKPIIDIMPIVYDITKVDKFNQAFKDIGYEIHGEYGITDRRYFTKSDKGTGKKLYHIHVYNRKDNKNIIRHLAFRDYLIEFPHVAREYENLKLKLVYEYNGDKDSYVNGKSKFVKEIEKLAINWYIQKR